MFRKILRCSQRRVTLFWALAMLQVSAVVYSSPSTDQDIAAARVEDNLIDTQRQVKCGTIVTNVTSILVRNPHHPEPTYTKTICETVIERANPTVGKLEIKFVRLELYRSTLDGDCLHDRFAVYTDLNAPVTPIMCGNQTGKSISVPFIANQTSLIVSVTTSELDHDRVWLIEIEQK